MSTLSDKVALFNSQNDKNVYGCIKVFLDRMGQGSPNTKKTYERHIRDFFKTMRNKDIEQLIESDLFFTKQQIETYQVALRNKYKTNTVNNTISALKKCYKKLEDYGFNVRESWFDLERYDNYDKESHDSLTQEEVVAIIELVSKTRKGFEKALLVRLAFATAFRKTSLLNLKWTDIGNRDGIWYIKTLGKGNKWSYKKLSDDLYNVLMKFRAEVNREKIFELTDKTVNKMMDYIRSNMDFGDRKIVFHSFKKASIQEVNLISGGDIKAMQNHGDHASSSTTLNDYLKNKELDELVMVDVDTEIPVEEFDKLSHEELLKLVKEMDRSTQIRLLKKMGVM